MLERAPDRLAVERDASLRSMDTASPGPADPRAVRARNGELASRLRAAAMEGDETGLKRLLSELLLFQGVPRGQRVALQRKALVHLVQSLRAVAVNDELTGLYNLRGFMQGGTRLLDVAARDGRAAHLICLEVERLKQIMDTLGRSVGFVLLRQTGNLLRDLCPGYGVYEVLGRLSSDRFAALTLSEQYASRSAILLRTMRPHAASSLPALSLRIGVAHFDPRRPAGLTELLERAAQGLRQHDEIAARETATRTDHANCVARAHPPPGMTRDGLEAADAM